MTNAEKLLDLIQREGKEALNVEFLKEARNEAQVRCHEAQQRFFAIQNERFMLLQEMNAFDPSGAKTLLMDLIDKMVEPK